MKERKLIPNVFAIWSLIKEYLCKKKDHYTISSSSLISLKISLEINELIGYNPNLSLELDSKVFLMIIITYNYKEYRCKRTPAKRQLTFLFSRGATKKSIK